MTKATSPLAARRKAAQEGWANKIGADLYITVGMGTCGLAAGAEDSLVAIERELQARGLQAVIGRVGCVGMCSYEPMVELQTHGRPRVNYGQATAESIPEIFAAYLDGQPLQQAVIVGEAVPVTSGSDGRVLHSLSFVDADSQEEIAFQQKQLRIVLSNCGLIDPESLDDYLALDGYVALDKALAMDPEAVIEEMTRSGLRGR